MVDTKEFKVEDIHQVSVLRVEICDLKQNPLENIRFDVSVDKGTSSSFKTDENGIFKVPAKTEVKLTLVGIEASNKNV